MMAGAWFFSAFVILAILGTYVLQGVIWLLGAALALLVIFGPWLAWLGIFLINPGYARKLREAARLEADRQWNARHGR